MLAQNHCRGRPVREPKPQLCCATYPWDVSTFGKNMQKHQKKPSGSWYRLVSHCFMCSDFATFIGDRSWHPHWDKRWQTPYPRSPAMVDPLWASMSAEGWRATQDYSRSVSAHWSQRAGGSQGSLNGWWLWRFFKDLHFLEHFGATRKMETCLSDPCGSRFISLNARQARAIQAHWNTVHRHIMRDCRSSIGLKKTGFFIPHKYGPTWRKGFSMQQGSPLFASFSIMAEGSEGWFYHGWIRCFPGKLPGPAAGLCCVHPAAGAPRILEFQTAMPGSCARLVVVPVFGTTMRRIDPNRCRMEM